MLKSLFAILCFVISVPAFAGKSGYILNGKMVVVYEDGKKVGKYPSEDESRKPDATKKATDRDMGYGGTGMNITIFFDEDDIGRCYFVQPGQGEQRNLSCIKLK